jgi:hypothetical protein
MLRLRHVVILAAVGAALGGCATYDQTGQKLKTGYYEDLKMEAERDAEQARDEQLALQRDVDAVQQEQQAVSSQITAQERQLAKI